MATPDYDVVEVPGGETQTFRVGDGETFGNVILDITQPGAVARVIIEGRDAAVRNVAWRGVQDVRSYAVLAHVGSGDCLIDNVYLGDGVHPDINHSAGGQTPTAIWASPESSGSLTVRRANISDWADNGMYLSSATGTVMTVENSYVKATANSNIRVGTDGSVIRNCVIRDTIDRGVWVWGPASATVENCHVHAPNASAFWAGEGSHPNATINVTDTEWSGEVTEVHGSTVNFQGGNGNAPEDFYPEDCPTSAEGAAGGGGSSPTQPPNPSDRRTYGAVAIGLGLAGAAYSDEDLIPWH